MTMRAPCTGTPSAPVTIPVTATSLLTVWANAADESPPASSAAANVEALRRPRKDEVEEELDDLGITNHG